MKTLLLKSAFLLMLIFSAVNGSAQQLVSYDATDSSTCDGYAVVYDSALIIPTSTFWSSGGVIIQQGGFQIYDLCPGTYIFNYDTGNGNQMYTFVIGSGSSNPCSGFGATITYTNASDSTSCDGVAVVMPYGGTPAYAYNWSNGSTTANQNNLCPGVYYCTVVDMNGCSYSVTSMIGVSNSQTGVYTVDASDSVSCNGEAMLMDSVQNTTSIYWQFNGTVIYQGSTYINNLCSGTYAVNFTDNNGVTQTYSFTIGAGNADPCSGFYADVVWVDPSEPAVCDGQAYVSANGGSGGYSFLWSNGMTTQSIVGLCEGLYYCTVTSSSGCSFTATAYLIGNSSDSVVVIDNNNYPDSTIVDNLGNGLIENCIIDYLSVDSVYIGNYYYTSLDSLMVSWVVVDSNGLVVVVLDIPYGINGTPNGVYSMYVTIFCPQKDNNINTLVAGDQVYLDGSQLGINETTENDFVVINPIGNDLQIFFNSASQRSISLTDLNGKVLMLFETNEMNPTATASELVQGMYILYVTENGVSTSRKLIK